MWLLLAFVSATLLGLYDVVKKISLERNAVIPVLLRGVYRIVHKKLERKCERKACKYKEFERFEGDLGKKNEMYTGLICFNLV